MAHMRDRVAGWVHESARANPIDAARHQTFIQVRLLITFLAIILIPPYLALRGGLAGWEATIAFCALTPLGAIFVLSRTGDFTLAQIVSTFAYAATSLAFAVGSNVSAWPEITPSVRFGAVRAPLPGATATVATATSDPPCPSDAMYTN